MQDLQQLLVHFRLQFLGVSLEVAQKPGPEKPRFLKRPAVPDDGGKREVQPVQGVINVKFFGNVEHSHVA
jgi:hypothetical protein